MSTVISIEGLGKRYMLGATPERYVALRDVLASTAKDLARRIAHPRRSSRENAPEEFWALRDIDFTVKQGDRIGIVGRNGAGKSTLLKVLSRITEPTTGTVRLRGRMASLLEVGTGFHPELTGRENIFLNGAILGMTKSDVRKRFDEIVEFAEIERFLDTPVKRYSSGMYVRLAFAVAAHLEPDILVIDEVLAVGDAQFQNKCLGKMGEASGQGRTVLFVSHNVAALRHLCRTGVYLERGQLVLAGPVGDCIDRYLQVTEKRASTILAHGIRKSQALNVDRVIVNGLEADTLALESGATSLTIEIHGTVVQTARVNVEVRLLSSPSDVVGICSPAYQSGETEQLSPGPFRLRTVLMLPKLNRGDYFLNITVYDPGMNSHWEFPHAVRLEAEGWVMATGMTFEHARGVGAVLLDGNTTYL